MENIQNDNLIDVEKIMNQIREDVCRKKELGIYTGADIRVSNLSMRIPVGTNELSNQILFLQRHYDFRMDYNIASHRPLLGRLIVAGKRIFLPILAKALNPFFDNQVRFNQQLVNTMALIAERLHQQEGELMSLRLQQEGSAAPVSTRQCVSQGDRTGQMPGIVEAFNKTEADNWYFFFEHFFREKSDKLKEHQRIYLPYFRGADTVLDIGCGKGEFLELLKEEGINAIGIDTNSKMVEYSMMRSLMAIETDAMSYLCSIEDNSLCGIFMSQVIEHMTPEYLMSLLKLCYFKLRPGCCIVLETVNPLCLSTFARTFYRDLTHIKPVHPETIQTLLNYLGFKYETTLFLSPIPDEERLQGVLPDKGFKGAALTEQLNSNFHKLNSLLFSYQDFAIIARKSEGN